MYIPCLDKRSNASPMYELKDGFVFFYPLDSDKVNNFISKKFESWDEFSLEEYCGRPSNLASLTAEVIENCCRRPEEVLPNTFALEELLAVVPVDGVYSVDELRDSSISSSSLRWLMVKGEYGLVWSIGVVKGERRHYFFGEFFVAEDEAKRRVELMVEQAEDSKLNFSDIVLQPMVPASLPSDAPRFPLSLWGFYENVKDFVKLLLSSVDNPHLFKRGQIGGLVGAMIYKDLAPSWDSLRWGFVSEVVEVSSLSEEEKEFAKDAMGELVYLQQKKMMKGVFVNGEERQRALKLTRKLSKTLEQVLELGGETSGTV